MDTFVAVFTGFVAIAVIYMGLKVVDVSPSKVWKAGLGKLKSLFTFKKKT